MAKYGITSENAMEKFPYLWGKFISGPDEAISWPDKIDIPIQ